MFVLDGAVEEYPGIIVTALYSLQLSEIIDLLWEQGQLIHGKKMTKRIVRLETVMYLLLSLEAEEEKEEEKGEKRGKVVKSGNELLVLLIQ